jgi:dihydroorotate dehydrogenase
VRAPIIAYDPEATKRVLTTIKDRLPGYIEVWVKLSPVMNPETDPIIPEILDAIDSVGIGDTLVVGNTLPVDTPIIDGKPLVSMPKCGMSGTALRPYSIGMIQRIRSLQPHRRIYGAGGIHNGPSASEFLELDVTGIQIGQHYFQYGPRVFGEILQQIPEFV